MSIRPYVLLYISERSRPKLLEWQRTLRRYGVDVRGIPYPTERVENTPPDAERRLRTGEPGLLGVMVDNSELVVPGTGRPAPRVHMQQVEHLCRVEFRWLEGDAMRTNVHVGRARGYLDLIDGPADGWWDDRFRMDEVGATLTEWREKTGSKVSARDIAAADFIAERIHKPMRDFTFFGVVPGRPVSFERLALEDADEHPFIADPSIDAFGLRGLFRAVGNMGVHYRAPTDKRQSVLWDPGLHGGIPTVTKPDALHETTYALAHDGMHHLFLRRMYTGTASEGFRRVNMVVNMLSEAFSQVLADMAFVDAVRSTGFEYDYTKRGIWPLFKTTGLSGKPIQHDELLKLLLANGMFAMTGRTDAWETLTKGPSATASLTQFRDYYGKFFRADLVWNAANWRDMTSRADEFRRWWELVGPVVRANGLGLQTLPELAAACGVSDADSTETLVEKIGTYQFRTRIQPLLANPPSPEPHDRILGRAFARWMCGQLLALVRYDFLPEVRHEAQMIADTLCRHPVRSHDDIARIRSFFERRIERLAARGMLADADAVMWKEMVPHVEPRFVGYVNAPETHAEAARRLLEGRSDDMKPGVGIFIRDKDNGRGIFQRKDWKHPEVDARGRLSGFGGSLEEGEEPEDALARELPEEIDNELLVAEVMAHARYRRRFRLSANPWPGEYDFYAFDAAVDSETFDRLARDFLKPGTVREGMAIVLEADEIQSFLDQPNSFLCSHNEVVTELLPAA